MRAAIFILAVAACSAPPLTIRYEILGGADGSCKADACTGVSMLCDSMLFVRILDPKDPKAPFVSTCQQVHTDSPKDLCSIASVDIPSAELPERTLEVQVVVLPLAFDDNDQPNCDP